MDAKERLRRYLEQRRELGETELVLDGMTVEEVMRLLGAGRGAGRHLEREVELSPGTGAPEPSAADWRSMLRAAGGDPGASAERDRASDRTGAAGSPDDVSARDRAIDRDRDRAAPRPGDEFGGHGMEDSPAPGAATPEPQAAAEAPPRAPPSTRARAGLPPVAPAGIVVGRSDQELFGGEMSSLATLDELAAVVAKCTRCPLYSAATNPVPGEGNPSAELVCVGEAPGANEDASGRPFVGQAGQLLTKILAAIRLERGDVFICNVLKHRPPGNRNPRPEEVVACSPYLVRQLELIRPKVIVAFGTFAAQTLLNTKESIGKLRGRVHRYYGVPLVVTYHPAALLRNPAWKRPTWEDVQLARRILDSAAGA